MKISFNKPFYEKCRIIKEKVTKVYWSVAGGSLVLSFFTAFIPGQIGSIIHTIFLSILGLCLLLPLFAMFISDKAATITAKYQEMDEKEKEELFKQYIEESQIKLKEEEEKRKADFEKWYNSVSKMIDTGLADIEETMKPIRKKQNRLYIVSTIPLWFFISIYFIGGNHDILLFIILSIGGGLFFSAVFYTLIDNFYWGKKKQALINNSYDKNFGHFKTSIINNLIKTFSNNLNYNPDKGIPENDYMESELFGNIQCTHIYSSEDLISLHGDKTSFQLSECRAEEVLGSGGNVVLFNGLMMMITLDKKSNNWVRFGTYGRKIIETDQYLVEMENPVFNSFFKVYSSDKTYARKILTPHFMEFIVSFIHHMGGSNNSCCFTFKKDKIYIGYPSWGDFLEFTGPESITKDVLYSYYKLLNLFNTFYQEVIKNYKNWG